MNETKSTPQKTLHNLLLSSREKLTLSGVKEILNFDDTEVNLRTVCGDLTVEGSNIRISVLNVEKGEVEMEGKINAVYYYDVGNDESKKSLLSRIFK